jgi:hypothetical protein
MKDFYYSNRFGEKTLVKIIRKGYPNAIGNNGDPYSTLK